jgi:hypothetical protein
MTSANDNGNQKKTLTSLRDLPRSIQPPRDLWAGIESQIVAEQKAQVAPRSSSARSVANLRWMAAAAVIAALAVGMWIGRTTLPNSGMGQSTMTAKNPTGTAGSDTQTSAELKAAIEGPDNSGSTFQAAYFADPKYRKTRAALMKSVEEKMNSLPPDTRKKVISSLQTIHQSMKDLEAALGKEPSNALLQGLLISTYQDEMRVLTTVQEAGTTGEGI